MTISLSIPAQHVRSMHRNHDASLASFLDEAAEAEFRRKEFEEAICKAAWEHQNEVARQMMARVNERIKELKDQRFKALADEAIGNLHSS